MNKDWEEQFDKKFGVLNSYQYATDKESTTGTITTDVNKEVKSFIRQREKELLEEVIKDLYKWYDDRQAKRGIAGWTDDYFSEGDTLSGNIITIIKKKIGTIK
ncbi:hypothetical protein LCGC14_0615300 [marine sediment metagenome]|uniref:Uncharacterized protein n=1 Tax=marine sediment metagenome TaxID=412755 RepID=A0A0F9R6I3_9ZZZZ|nr:hypothetical protein [Pricia sp.]HEC64637.1 hypothetical protein [bacterium]